MNGAVVEVLVLVGSGSATPHIELLGDATPAPRPQVASSALLDDHGDRIELLVDDIAALAAACTPGSTARPPRRPSASPSSTAAPSSSATPTATCSCCAKRHAKGPVGTGRAGSTLKQSADDLGRPAGDVAHMGALARAASRTLAASPVAARNAALRAWPGACARAPPRSARPTRAISPRRAPPASPRRWSIASKLDPRRDRDRRRSAASRSRRWPIRSARSPSCASSRAASASAACACRSASSR